MGDLSLGPYWLHSCLQWHPFPALLSAFLGGEQWDFHCRKARQVSYSCLGGQSRHPNKMIQVPTESQARNSALS